MKVKISIITVLTLFILSCNKTEELIPLEKKSIEEPTIHKSEVEIVNNDLKSEIYLFEGKKLEIKTEESHSTSKLSEEWTQTFNLPNLVTYYDGSGITRLFRDYDGFKRWEKTIFQLKTKISPNKSQITGYARLYDVSYYRGSRLLLLETRQNVNLTTIAFGSDTWNDKVSSVIVNNTRVHFHEHIYGGKRYIMEDRNMSPTIAIGQKNFRRVWLGGLKSWDNRITALSFFPY